MDTDKRFRFEKKTRMVVFITALTMAVEIYFGLRTNSMALLADGIHMASHVLALGLSWIAYILVRKLNTKNRFNGDSNKILSLSGYSSGLMLLIFAFVIMVEAVKRILDPSEIHFREAILVAIIGLVVNIVSALILHHKHEHSDHNIRAAYLHVVADALTSITAIIGLTAAMLWDIIWLDAAVAMLASVVIIRWSVSLMRDSGAVLLDIRSGNGTIPK
jgi:cation diffusion facilitator family transporter